MTNPFNPDAGDTPAPANTRDRALVERSARVIWRAFPYFAWRYGERLRAFGRSDAGYLVTLVHHDEHTRRKQVAWLLELLAPRGMPSILLEYQLESLGRVWRRGGGLPEANAFFSLAAELRAARWSVLDEPVFGECERVCRAEARTVLRRRGAGILIAAAVADRALGHGAHEDALVEWLSQAQQPEVGWARACSAALALARSRCRPRQDTSP